MNTEKYTERARGFLQAAQTIALREGHQQFAPEHVLKALLDDDQGLAAGLIDAAGAVPSKPGARWKPCSRRPRRWRGGSGGLYLTPPLARVFETAEKAAEKAGDSFVTVERLLLTCARERQSRRQGARQRGRDRRS